MFTLMLAENEVLHFCLTSYEYEMINQALIPIAMRGHLSNGNIVQTLMQWLQERAMQANRAHKAQILSACGLSDIADIFTLIARYRALSLSDHYWIKEYGESVRYADVNLYRNAFSPEIFSAALYGANGVSVTGMTPELNLRGAMAKAYKKCKDGIYLYKTGSTQKIRAELFASKVAYYCGMDSVIYTRYADCVRCKLETSIDMSWVPARALTEGGMQPVNLAMELSPRRYCEMRIFDYITGNIDRHHEN